MKKVLTILFLSFFFFLLPPPIHAQSSWTIPLFKSDITILNDGTVHIEEHITADFNSLSKHGIYRTIPYVYDGGNERIYTEIDVLSVLRNGNAEKYDESRTGSNITLKIGDANTTISGIQRYEISYQVKGVLRNYESYDELYWNITGNDWEVEIQKAIARISITDANVLKITCFEGSFGSTNECQIKSNESNSATFESELLSPGQGLSVVVGYEPGKIPILQIIPPKSTWERITNPYALLAFITVFIIGNTFVVRRWWKVGRDRFFGARYIFEKGAKEKTKPLFHNDTIVVEFTPPDNLRPAELGVLQDERADTKDITATIIDLASRGFLEIEEIPKKWVFGTRDYQLTKKSKDTSGLFSYEKILYDKLFDKGDGEVVKISELKMKFYTDLAKVKEQLYEDVVEKKFFPTNPEKVRTKYAGIAIGILIASIVLSIISINSVPEFFDIFLATSSSGLLLLILSRFMSRRTAHGQELSRRAEGYELFISQVEKHKQIFLENKNIITQILPYTIIFGLTEKFANDLKDIGITPPTPSWYHSTRPFIYSDFSKSMNTFSSSMSSSISSSPKSSGFSGGGSSGGGFGGGGGGSW